MNPIETLRTIASEAINDNDTKKWVFRHNHNENEYEQVMRAIKILSRYQPVEWTGTAGNREPVYIEA
jgi:hypothetical protein